VGGHECDRASKLHLAGTANWTLCERVQLFTHVKPNTNKLKPLTYGWYSHHGVHMFTETLVRRSRWSPLLDLLAGPHGVDRYIELVNPTWTRGKARARIVAVRRQTPRSVTLTLAPNRAFTGFKAGQHLNLTVEVDGRRRPRCYSPASADCDRHLELTIGRHEGGLVSTYLYDHARTGMVVDIDSVGGDFTLPDPLPRRILFVSGGSGITPVMSMLRTLRAGRYDGEIAFVHYARSAAEACYADELADMTGVRVLHGYTRDQGGDLSGHFDADHLVTATEQRVAQVGTDEAGRAGHHDPHALLPS